MEGWSGHFWKTGWGDVRRLRKKLTLMRQVDAAVQRPFAARRPALRGARVKMFQRNCNMSARHRKEHMPGELPRLCLGRLPDLCCAAVRPVQNSVIRAVFRLKFHKSRSGSRWRASPSTNRNFQPQPQKRQQKRRVEIPTTKPNLVSHLCPASFLPTARHQRGQISCKLCELLSLSKFSHCGFWKLSRVTISFSSMRDGAFPFRQLQKSVIRASFRLRLHKRDSGSRWSASPSANMNFQP